MKNNTVLIIAIIALILGHASGYFISANKKGSMHNEPTQTMKGTMDGMTASLEGKTGDEFDKAFISGMIVHHEGAVVMAQAAQQNAKHPEIKKMAQDIITAQTNEIVQMRAWLKAWYGIDASENSNHSSMPGSVHSME